MPIVLFKGNPRDGVAFIATSISGSKIDATFASSIFDSAQKIKTPMCLEVYAENCHVDDGRNRLVRDFLETDCTDLIFIDADIRWQASDLQRLIDYGHDVIGGTYPLKQEEEGFPIMHFANTQYKDGIIEVQGMPTGFLKIKRHVLEELAKDADSFRSKDDWDGREKIPVIFERSLGGHNRRGGDYTFCKKWRDRGGKIYCDPDFRLEHNGNKAWTRTYRDHLREVMGIGIAPMLDQIAKNKVTQDTIIDIISQWNNGFSVAHEILVYIITEARKAEGSILELGSGLTTLAMAKANPNVTIHSVEHDKVWVHRVRDELKRYDISNVVLHYAPLRNYGVYSWYDVDCIPKEQYSLTICDGPPRKHSDRNGLFEHLTEFIKDGVVISDDCDSFHELHCIEKWSENNERDIKVIGQHRPFAISKAERIINYGKETV